jgi:2,4-dienoyl-CoA reductase-like NADH-dependent reductase (Old Yellow Enzyme family)
MVNPEDLEAPGNPIAFQPYETQERVLAFKRLAAAAKKNGSLCIMQISHAGRQAADHFNKRPVSASDVQLEPRRGMSFAKPTPLTKEGIKEIIEQVHTFNPPLHDLAS